MRRWHAFGTTGASKIDYLLKLSEFLGEYDQCRVRLHASHDLQHKEGFGIAWEASLEENTLCHYCFYRQASTFEGNLLAMLPSCTTAGRASASTANKSPLATLSPSKTRQGIEMKTTSVAPLSPPLPPPFLLSRSHTSIELLPAPFLHPSSSPLSNRGDNAVREKGDERATLGSDGEFNAVTAASEYRARPITRGTRVAKVSESPNFGSRKKLSWKGLWYKG